MIEDGSFKINPFSELLSFSDHFLSKIDIRVDSFFDVTFESITALSTQKLQILLNKKTNQHEIDYVLSILPKKLNLAHLFENQVALLEWLLELNYVDETLGLLPGTIDLSSLTKEASSLLISISKKSNISDKKELLKRTNFARDFYTLSDTARYFLDEYFDEDLFRKDLEKIPKLEDEASLSLSAGELISFDINQGYLDFWLPRLPEHFSFPSAGLARICYTLIEVSPTVLFARLPEKMNQEDLGRTSEQFFSWLVAGGYSKKVLSMLEPSASPNNYFSSILIDVMQDVNRKKKSKSLSKKMISFLVGFPQEYYVEQIKKLLPSKVSIDQASDRYLALVARLIRYDISNKDLFEITGTIDLSKTVELSFGLKDYCAVNPDKEIADFLPKDIKLTDMCGDLETYLAIMELTSSPEINGMGKAAFKQLLSKNQLPDTISIEEKKAVLASLSGEGMLYFAYFDVAHLFKDLLIEPNEVRRKINIDSSEVIQKCGPNLEEQLAALPINANGWVQKGDWYVGELHKTGSQSKVFVKTDKLGKIESVLFRNFGISKRSIDLYGRVAQEIPEFVSTSNYPELGDQAKIDYISLVHTEETSSNREVYAGPNLKSLNLESFPQEIQESIILQKNYIFLHLEILGIYHGHAFDHNFNLRFLLEDSNGSKQIIFDPTAALLKAQSKKMFITPIVILRDWDQADFF